MIHKDIHFTNNITKIPTPNNMPSHTPPSPQNHPQITNTTFYQKKPYTCLYPYIQQLQTVTNIPPNYNHHQSNNGLNNLLLNGQ